MKSRSRLAVTFKKVRLAVCKSIAESDQLRPTNSLPFIMQGSGAKRPAKLLQRESTEENDRADTLSDACQEGKVDGDDPACQTDASNAAETPDAVQDTPLLMDPDTHVYQTEQPKISYSVDFKVDQSSAIGSRNLLGQEVHR